MLFLFLFFEKPILLWHGTHNFKLFSAWFSHFSGFIPRPCGARNKFQTFQASLILLSWTRILRLNEQNQSLKWIFHFVSSEIQECFVLLYKYGTFFSSWIVSRMISEQNFFWKPLFILVLFYGIFTNTAESCSLLATGTTHSVLYGSTCLPYAWHWLLLLLGIKG